MRADQAREIIDRVGGNTAFGEWFGVPPATVSMWKLRGFPPTTYAAMSAALQRDFGIDAPASVWGQIELERA